jgi:hypothetical protein
VFFLDHSHDGGAACYLHDGRHLGVFCSMGTGVFS